jgi:hypothetical protein
LFTEILDNKAVAPVALPVLSQLDAPGGEIEIPVHLYPCHGRRSLSVIELSAGQLAPPAADTLGRISNDNALGLFDDDERLGRAPGKGWTECGSNNNETPLSLRNVRLDIR